MEFPAGGFKTLTTEMPRVLVVDDDPVNKRLVAEVFSGADYEVRTAASGPEAIDLIEAGGAFDILVSDIVMRSMSGHDLAQWVAAHTPSTAIILMTAYNPGCPGCPYAPRCVVLPKPLVPEQVLSLVRRMLMRGTTAAKRPAPLLSLRG